MAHAVSGSAYSAKGGNLKFADVVRERFRGPAFGQDFTTWLDEVLLGFETANISESSQVTHLVAFLESPNREIAVAYLKKWKEENPQPEPAARAADRESAMRDYHRAQWQALVAHLKTQSTVVGTRPEMRLNRGVLPNVPQEFASLWDTGTRAFPHLVHQTVNTSFLS